MGKASSAKKVARAARAGGRRTSGQRRQFGFPVAVGLIIVLGLSLVVFARQSGQASADNANAPQPNVDHWHASYGIFICDHFVTNLADKGTDALGIHTHEDGLIHVHPFTGAAAGKKATLSKFFAQTGMKVTNSEIKLPEAEPFKGRLYEEGKTTCGGKPATVLVEHWKSAAAAAAGGKANATLTKDFGKTRIAEDKGAYTIAFVAKGTKVPAPPGAAQLEVNAQKDAGATAPTDSGTDTVDPALTVSVPVTSAPASDTTAPGASTTAPTQTTAPPG